MNRTALLSLLIAVCALSALLVADEVRVAAAPSPQSEMAAAETHLYSKVPAEDVNYIRYFTTYAIPEKVKIGDAEVAMRQQAELALSFVVNSCASAQSEGYIERPHRVPGSDTLWYIDVRDYGWKTDDLDVVFKIQPYFLYPVVESKNNVILYRADWFIVNAMDLTKQDDRGLKDFVYYILQYGKGNEPKNADDFRRTWLVDIKTIRAQKLETGSVVDKGESGVSQHTRQLRRGRTVAGYYWETRDVKSHDLDPDRLKSRDYIEDIFANQVDAGEYIASHKNGLQVYLLTAGTNQKFAEVKFADHTLVVDRQDNKDPRVRTPKSCVVCHMNGIIPYTNAIRDLFRLGGNLKFKNKDLAREVKAFYLKYDGSEVEEDNRIFERAVKQCNGLTPEANMRAFLDVYEWYWTEKLTLAQAAVECGVEVETLRKALSKATTGRLVYLYHGKGIHREIWDSIHSGGYIQSMLLLRVASGKATPQPVARDEQGSTPGVVEVVVEQTALLDRQDRTIGYLGRGVQARVYKVYDRDWYYVIVGQMEGFLRRSHTKAVNTP